MPAIDFPYLGFATSEGTILKWLVNVGDSVRKGDDLLEIVAEKAVAVVVAEEEGILQAIYAEPGAIVPEGETVGWIGTVGEPAPAHACRILGWEEEIAPPPPGLARRLAGTPTKMTPLPSDREPSGHEAPPPVRPIGRLGKAARSFLKGQIRKVTGLRMTKAWEAPKVDLFTDVDFSRVVAHRQQMKTRGLQPPSYNVYIAHAASRAFEVFPDLNVNYIDGNLVPVDGIHIGVAVALETSLVTISMKDVGGLSLEELQKRFRALIKKAAAMSLSRDELYGSSLTVTNLGEFEITGFTPILNPPEIFILGIGMLRERVESRDGEFTTVPYSTFCLSFDHRGVDGAPASRLLRQIKHNLERYE